MDDVTEHNLERAFDDMIGLGLLAPIERQNRNGNPLFVKTKKAKAMGDEAFAEALASAGERAGQPLSRDRKLSPGADTVCVVEGNMSKNANASTWATRRGRRTWHARMLRAREPGDLMVYQRQQHSCCTGPRREGEEP